MGVSESRGYQGLGFRVLLLFRGTIIGSPIFGNSHMGVRIVSLVVSFSLFGVTSRSLL